MTFEFDASALAGHDTVAFEKLTRDGDEVTVRTDIDKEGQTVKITPPVPEIGTTATDADDGDHETVADDSVTINYKVAYKGLTPGKECTMTGTLMDKETGKTTQSDGKDVAPAVTFPRTRPTARRQSRSPLTAPISAVMRLSPSRRWRRTRWRCHPHRHQRRGADREADPARHGEASCGRIPEGHAQDRRRASLGRNRLRTWGGSLKCRPNRFCEAP